MRKADTGLQTDVALVQEHGLQRQVQDAGHGGLGHVAQLEVPVGVAFGNHGFASCHVFALHDFSCAAQVGGSECTGHHRAGHGVEPHILVADEFWLHVYEKR